MIITRSSGDLSDAVDSLEGRSGVRGWGQVAEDWTIENIFAIMIITLWSNRWEYLFAIILLPDDLFANGITWWSDRWEPTSPLALGFPICDTARNALVWVSKTMAGSWSMNPSDSNWFKISALLSGERTLRASVCRRDGSWGCKPSPSNALPAPHSLCKVVLHGPQVLFSQNCLPLPELMIGVGALWGGVDSTANNSSIHSRTCHFEVLPLHSPSQPPPHPPRPD